MRPTSAVPMAGSGPGEASTGGGEAAVGGRDWYSSAMAATTGLKPTMGGGGSVCAGLMPAFERGWCLATAPGVDREAGNGRDDSPASSSGGWGGEQAADGEGEGEREAGGSGGVGSGKHRLGFGASCSGEWALDADGGGVGRGGATEAGAGAAAGGGAVVARCGSESHQPWGRSGAWLCSIYSTRIDNLKIIINQSYALTLSAYDVTRVCYLFPNNNARLLQNVVLIFLHIKTTKKPLIRKQPELRIKCIKNLLFI